ncbi:MAG: triosephosphate isomerase [Gemmatales bacterium]|nr:MAG: triosephosphate isomerase [Gemmatales bacterium]
MRKLFVAGNWKMFTTLSSARQLAQGIVDGFGENEKVLVGVFPPFPYLLAVAEIVRGKTIVLGGQNLYPAAEGAFTGEVSPTMLLDCGCQYVILGHSERRHKIGESDAFINQKVHTALNAGLKVIFCIGEKLEERDAQKTNQVLERQLTTGLAGLTQEQVASVVIAYEPVWAIGTGKNATPEEAEQAHTFIRGQIGQMFGSANAESVVIQYGGSVNPNNAESLLAQPNVDGVLVGGASLKVDQFSAIIEAGMRVASAS